MSQHAVSQHTISQRIVVVGTSGSGKTTLAKRIAQRGQLQHVELDALHWEPNWTTATEPVFRQRVTEALQGDRCLRLKALIR